MIEEHQRIESMISDRTGKVFRDPSRSMLIENSVSHWNAIRLESGTLVTWTPRDSTGRNPRETYIVRRPKSEETIDWDAPNSIPMTPETFDIIFEDVTAALDLKDRIYVLNRSIGADPEYAMPVCAVMHNVLAGPFTDNMFRPLPPDVGESCFSDSPFYVLISQFDKIDYEEDPIFHALVPAECPDVPSRILHAAVSWSDRSAFERNAGKLAAEFEAHFQQQFKDEMPHNVAAQCPAVGMKSGSRE